MFTSTVWSAFPVTVILGGIVSTNTFWPTISFSVKLSIAPRWFEIKAVMLVYISIPSAGIVTDAFIVFGPLVPTFVFKFRICTVLLVGSIVSLTVICMETVSPAFAYKLLAPFTVIENSD